METKKRIGIVSIATIVAPIIVIILVLGTIFTGRHASGDTEKAVRNVTLLFMNELANRREQVVASKLNGYINDLDVAVGLLSKEDLASTASLQNYQLRMKQLYGLEKFAFVDTTGLIYTSRGTRTDIDLYNFDYRTLAKSEISLKKNSEEKKTVVIAVPVDRLAFNGRVLVVCFMEIDMNRMLEGISLESDRQGITFCNIYSKAGNSLTNLVLGGLASGDNLLAAMEKAGFEKGFSMEKMRSDFANHEAGVVSFEYNGIRETMYYVPIYGLDADLPYPRKRHLRANRFHFGRHFGTQPSAIRNYRASALDRVPVPLHANQAYLSTQVRKRGGRCRKPHQAGKTGRTACAPAEVS